MVGIKGKSGGKRVGAGSKATGVNKSAKNLSLSFEVQRIIKDRAKEYNKSQAEIVEIAVREANKKPNLFD